MIIFFIEIYETLLFFNCRQYNTYYMIYTFDSVFRALQLEKITLQVEKITLQLVEITLQVEKITLQLVKITLQVEKIALQLVKITLQVEKITL